MDWQDKSSELIGKNVKVVVASLEIGLLSPYFLKRLRNITLAKNATKPNPFEIISLQTTRKKNNWKTEETLARTVVTLETERIKASNP